ncbi:MAG TPA: helix-turn-helix domain-containing protein [Vicinamibacterales bacterium]|nr:helix-turn-helix domain-containing protein [Vicinamibacterales bacterium]
MSEEPRDRGRSLFIDEAAAALGVSRRTVYYRIQHGELQTIKTRCGSRRVLMSSIEALLRREREERAYSGRAELKGPGAAV